MPEAPRSVVLGGTGACLLTLLTCIPVSTPCQVPPSFHFCGCSIGRNYAIQHLQRCTTIDFRGDIQTVESSTVQPKHLALPHLLLCSWQLSDEMLRPMAAEPVETANGFCGDDGIESQVYHHLCPCLSSGALDLNFSGGLVVVTQSHTGA